MARFLFEAYPRGADANNDPASGAKLYVYEAGTTTPVTVYSDKAMTVAHAIPVVADASGAWPEIYAPDGQYKVVITNAYDVTLQTVDNVSQFAFIEEPERSVATLADMVADTEVAVGDYILTLGYYSPGDGGGNLYQIVAAGTGTADGGSYIDLTGISGQAKGLFPDGVRWEQFGAVGDADVGNATPTDDTAACQACLDFLPTLNGDWSEYEDGEAEGDIHGRIEILGMQGRVYGISDTLTYTRAHRGMVLNGGSFRAIDGGWATTDWMISPVSNGTHVIFQDVAINCDHKCSGTNLNAFSYYRGGEVVRYAGEGIRLFGSNSRASGAHMFEYAADDDGFDDYTNYTGTAIVTTGSDTIVEGCTLKWSAKLFNPQAVNWQLRHCHLTNGMEGGTMRPGGAILMEVPASAYGWAHDNYFDNGKIVLYNPHATFADNIFFIKSAATPADETAWFEIYAHEVDALDRVQMVNNRVQFAGREKKWIKWFDDGANVWGSGAASGHAQFLTLSASTAADNQNPFSFEHDAVHLSRAKELSWTYSTTQGAEHGIRDRDSTGWLTYGASGDDFVIDTPAGGRVDMIGAGKGLLVPQATSDPASPGDGLIYYNTSSNKLRLRAGAAWIDLN